MSRITQEMNVTLDGRDVRLTSLERVLWAEAGLTKGWLLRSYLALAPALLPHLRGHPITMWRYPEGIARAGWWQNECRGAPSWVSLYRYTGADGREHRHCVIDDVSSLMWLVNLGTIEIHPFPFSTERDDAPSWLVFDLDPGEPAGLQEACQVAERLHDVLVGQGVESFPKTSGAKGIHVFVPLDGLATFPEAKAYARTVAAFLASEAPDLVVDRQARALRSGKVLVDWLQNDRFRSTVAPYSLRATPTPNVSTPLEWSEVRAVAEGSADEAVLAFDVDEVLARVERDGDRFAPVLTMTQSLQA
jgi:bifunctional non-homologous end joining protein LigD